MALIAVLAVLLIVAVGFGAWQARTALRGVLIETRAIVGANLDRTQRLATTAERVVQVQARVYALTSAAAVDPSAISIDDEIGRIMASLREVRADIAGFADEVEDGDARALLMVGIERLDIYREAIEWVATVLDVDAAAAIRFLRPLDRIFDEVGRDMALVREAAVRDAGGRAARAELAAAQAGPRFIMIGAIGILCVAAIVWFAIGFLARQETDRRSLLDAVDKATSELRATVVALQDARAKAESASRAKSEFLANMSHELRTPLNAILGFSEVIRDELLGPVGKPKYLEYARDINDAGSHLLRLINEVLDLAKIEAGRMTIDAAPCDMAEVVRAATALVRPLAERKRLILNEPAADRVMPGYADDRIATQVIVNLLSNAVKFTPEGGVVSLELRRRDALGVRIVVADTGIGMTPAQIGIAFEKFGQVENAFSRTQEGTGLGLPLTRALVELHGGSVAIESVVGRGTTVTIDFPGPPAAPTDQNAPTS